jgi:hypothetical protein
MKRTFTDRHPLLALALFKLGILLCFLGFAASAVHGATLEEQIAAANRQADSLRVVANKLSSQRAAARLDSICQTDSALTASNVRIVGGRDSMWVYVVVSNATALQKRLVQLELVAFEAQRTSTLDTFYVRRDRAEKALPSLSAALK